MNYEALFYEVLSCPSLCHQRNLEFSDTVDVPLRLHAHAAPKPMESSDRLELLPSVASRLLRIQRPWEESNSPTESRAVPILFLIKLVALDRGGCDGGNGRYRKVIGERNFSDVSLRLIQ